MQPRIIQFFVQFKTDQLTHEKAYFNIIQNNNTTKLDNLTPGSYRQLFNHFIQIVRRIHIILLTIYILEYVARGSKDPYK